MFCIRVVWIIIIRKIEQQYWFFSSVVPGTMLIILPVLSYFFSSQVKYIRLLMRYIRFSIQSLRWEFWSLEGGSCPKWRGLDMAQSVFNLSQISKSVFSIYAKPHLTFSKYLPTYVHPVPSKILLLPTKEHSIWPILSYYLLSRPSQSTSCGPGLPVLHVGLLWVSVIWDSSSFTNFCPNQMMDIYTFSV